MTEEANPANQEGSEDPKPTVGGDYVTKEELKNVTKGIENLANKINSVGKSEEEDSEEDSKPEAVAYNPVVKKIYMKETPEIEEVWDEVMEEASQLGQDPIEYYEGKKGWQLEAKARAEAKQAKEDAKNNIESPSNVISADSNVNFDKITPDQISKLDREARVKYRDYLTKKEGSTQIIRRTN